jgi:hypothetical protein
MNSFAAELQAAMATRATVSEDTLAVELTDGRTIAAPLAWYPRLWHATVADRNEWRLIAGGRGIHWPAIDEDISVTNLLAGRASAEGAASLKKWLASPDTRSRRRKRSEGVTVTMRSARLCTGAITSAAASPAMLRPDVCAARCASSRT